MSLSTETRRSLLELARKAVERSLQGQIALLPPPGEDSIYREKCGVFVTIRLGHALRGCIGTLAAEEPLYELVQRMAVSAASQDPRFMPLKAPDLEKVRFEISVLSPIRKAGTPEEVNPGEHGIVIKKGARSGCFLPQVATEMNWGREELLSYCAAEKAGLGRDGWRDAEIYIFTAEVFDESGMVPGR